MSATCAITAVLGLVVWLIQGRKYKKKHRDIAEEAKRKFHSYLHTQMQNHRLETFWNRPCINLQAEPTEKLLGGY